MNNIIQLALLLYIIGFCSLFVKGVCVCYSCAIKTSVTSLLSMEVPVRSKVIERTRICGICQYHLNT